MSTHLLRLGLCLVASYCLLVRADDSRTVALMVQRPSNVLAWNALDEDAAFMLGCDRILQDYLDRTPAIGQVGAHHVNGIQSGMEAGLYFPQGEGIYQRWRPFLWADVYVECELSRSELIWRAGNASGDTFESPVIDQPYRQPLASAAALVRLVFEAAGVPLEAAWADELSRDEPTPPELFFEWAKWIGYRPHWLHHAPWQAPHQSAKRILEEDPGFARGAAWALPILQIPPKGRKDTPASPLYVPHALQLLDSPWAESAMPFLRKQAENKAVLRELVTGFGLPEMGLAVGFDMDAEPEDTGMPAPTGVVRLQTPDSARFRRNLALTLGGLQAETVQQVLMTLLEEDSDAGVRAAAAAALGGFDPEQMAAMLRSVLADDAAPAVRAAFFTTLVDVGICTEADVRQALNDAAAEVRRRVAGRLADCGLSAALQQELLLKLTLDGEATVRAAALEQLQASAPITPEVQPVLRRVLAGGIPEELTAALAWIRREKATEYAVAIEPLLSHTEPLVRAAAGRTLAMLDAAHMDPVIQALKDDPSPGVRQSLATTLAEVESNDPAHRDVVFSLLQQAGPTTRGPICAASYQLIGSDRAGLARAMTYDPSLTINLAALELVQRLNDAALTAELLAACVNDHPNEYIRARALRLMERHDVATVRDHALAGLASPYWVVRLEAADILSRMARPEDAGAIRQASEAATGKWLALALEDALCRAENRPIPERTPLGLGERQHMEGGDSPNGFQVWLGRLPADLAERRAMVDAGYRFGAKTVPANMPGGMVVNAYNRSTGARNTYLLDSILGPLTEWEDKLPYLYYIALFDEPGSLGTGYDPDRVRAMLLEAGRPDLLPLLDTYQGNELGQALPPELQRAWRWYNARFGAIASNWVVHMFRLTGQRQYTGLQIFPQSLSYMRKDTQDAFDRIDADGDYTWEYHYGNFFRDGTIGAVNRVLNPGKPLCMITWMSWWQPNVLHGNTLYADTDFPEGPWRYRTYMGTRSALALWATGAEAGFFDPIGLGRASNKEGQARLASAFALKPWSQTADDAIDVLLDDPGYWKQVEGQLALKLLKEKGGADAPDLDLGGGDAEDDPFMLEEGPTPLEKAMNEAREALREKLMTGISYMNIFNCDATRALSNLPKPDTRRRETLIIMGRDFPYYADTSHFPMPAIAVVQGYDMAPTYDAVTKADLMHYDTILLRACVDGVTSELVSGINRWLREKDNGLLIVWGDVTSAKVQFPSLSLDTVEEGFLWEDGVGFSVREQAEESDKDHRGRERTRQMYPRLNAFQRSGGTIEDRETRLYSTSSGALEPLLTTAGGESVLARWQAPAEVRGIVLFDGATHAGPVYTEALEAVILALDKERQSTVARNRWWGHTLYENEQFVVDVATSQLGTLHEARPRRHRGVDVITGVINPEVRHGECALILKDYVGPYAGAKGDWAVMAREQLIAMEVTVPGQLRVNGRGVMRITHIGSAPIRLENADGFTEVEHQVQVWKQMRAGVPAFSVNEIDGGWELHVYSPEPLVVIAD